MQPVACVPTSVVTEILVKQITGAKEVLPVVI